MCVSVRQTNATFKFTCPYLSGSLRLNYNSLVRNQTYMYIHIYSRIDFSVNCCQVVNINQIYRVRQNKDEQRNILPIVISSNVAVRSCSLLKGYKIHSVQCTHQNLHNHSWQILGSQKLSICYCVFGNRKKKYCPSLVPRCEQWTGQS